jgi:putative flippase GtrA
MTSDFWRIALASLIARVISTIVNYVVNKKYVFKGKTNNRQTAIRFLILTVIITILSTLFVYVFSTLGIMSEKLAKPVGDLLLFLLSYNVQMKWVFSKE